MCLYGGHQMKCSLSAIDVTWAAIPLYLSNAHTHHPPTLWRNYASFYSPAYLLLLPSRLRLRWWSNGFHLTFATIIISTLGRTNMSSIFFVTFFFLVIMMMTLPINGFIFNRIPKEYNPDMEPNFIRLRKASSSNYSTFLVSHLFYFPDCQPFAIGNFCQNSANIYRCIAMQCQLCFPSEEISRWCWLKMVLLLHFLEEK
jgi:hypothetical protein